MADIRLQPAEAAEAGQIKNRNDLPGHQIRSHTNSPRRVLRADSGTEIPEGFSANLKLIFNKRFFGLVSPCVRAGQASAAENAEVLVRWAERARTSGVNFED